jgi:glycosyltransferase involved in cell wall biosynthesis
LLASACSAQGAPAQTVYVPPQLPGPAVLVARLSPEKDLGTLLQAIKLLSQELSSPNPLLRIVGDGPERGALEQLTRSLALSSAVDFVGERQDIPEQLARASLFVLWSLTEGVSLTLWEAMARDCQPDLARQFSPDIVLAYWLHPDGAAATEVARKLDVPAGHPISTARSAGFCGMVQLIAPRSRS